MPRSRLYLGFSLALWWWTAATPGLVIAQTSPSSSSLLSAASQHRAIPKVSTSASTGTPSIASKTSSGRTLPVEDPLVRLAKKLSEQVRQDQSAALRLKSGTASSSSKGQGRYSDSGGKSSVVSKKKSVVSSSGMGLASPTESLPLGRRQGNADSSQDSAVADQWSGNGTWVLSTLTALGVVIGLILLVRVGLMRWSGRGESMRAGSVVQVISRTSLGPRSQVLLLRLGQRILVVAESPGGIRSLAEIDDTQEVADLLTQVAQTRSGSMSQHFRQMLKGADLQHDDPQKFFAAQGGDEQEYQVDRVRDELSSLLSRVRQMARGRTR